MPKPSGPKVRHAREAEATDLGACVIPSPSERERLAAIAATGLLDAAPGESLDRLTRLAKRLLRVPTAMLSLVTSDRQFFASAVGLASPYDVTRQTPISHSLCRHVVRSQAPLMIEDARKDPLHSESLAVRELGVIAYLGVPLVTAEGHVVGSFCVTDVNPHVWGEDDVASLRDLAEAAASEMRLRAEIVRRAEVEAMLLAREAQRDLAIQASGHIGFWEWEVGSAVVSMDRSFAVLFGIDPDEAASGLPLERYLAMIPEGDRATVASRVEAAVAQGGSFAAEHSLRRPDGTLVHVQSRGACTLGQDGRPARFTGILIDVTEQKRAFEHQTEMATELGHRIKNSMATVQAVVLQTLRDAPDVKSAAKGVVDRMQALSRGHDLLTARGWEGVDLRDVVSAMSDAFGGGRFFVEGPSLPLTARVTLAFSMALHELATNAVKYGALSQEGGNVAVRWSSEDEGPYLRTTLTWQESGGPTVLEPTRKGFGTRLLQRVLAAEVNGSVVTAYEPGGVRCTVEARIARATA